MKEFRSFILTAIAVASLCVSHPASAQVSATPPPATASPVVVDSHSDASLVGVPADLKTLIRSFQQMRDNYLAAQDLLLIRLKNATTATERDRIRGLLQTNREAFLSALKDFRQQLKDELTALKGKISHEEFLRIIDAAHNAAAEGGLSHHKGH